MFGCSDKNGYRIASPALGRTLTLQAGMRTLTTAALTWPGRGPSTRRAWLQPRGRYGCFGDAAV
jgi:hypothetical protein